LFIGHNLGWINVRAIDQLERIAYDVRLKATLEGGTDDRLVIVDVDEESLSALGHWPWSRDILARLVDNLFDHYQVDIAGFDMLFAERDTSSGLPVLERLAEGALRDIPEYRTALDRLRPSLEHDRLFAESLEGRPVITGMVFDQSQGTSKGALPEPVAAVGEKWKRRLPLFTPESYIGNLPVLQEHARGGGFFDNPYVDSDGIFRRVPLIQMHGDNLYPSLALAVAREALGAPKLEIVVMSSGETSSDYNAIELLRLGERSIRVDERIAALVPYRGAYPSFPYVSAVDVLERNVDPAVLEDKIVLLGSTAAGLQDLRAMPVQEVYPGVEVHANLITGILDERIKHVPPYTAGLELIVLVIIGVLMTAAVPFLSPLWTTAMTASLAAALIGVNMVMWHQGVVMPLAAALALLLLLYVLQTAYGFFVETRSKRALSKVFGQYIPPELVDELDENPDQMSLEGESREMTVLFSDVRGFTTISEGLEPKALSRLMNEFLTPLTGVIHKHRGTIDKYMGDAIMAFWGAPLKDPYHAKNALMAALEMIRVLNEHQAAFKARGWPPLQIGVGLNTGVMSVGNMGSEFRMAYTVLGDAVNLGSRLEGLTKRYGVDIIVSETVKEQLPEFEFLELDRVLVKGKDEPVTIYEPLGFSIELDKSVRKAVRRFHRALQQYRDRNWDTAEREIFTLSQSDPERRIYKIYLDRIMHYRNHPPPENWDGVFVHESK
jgi:adenylate cyclase